MMPFDQGDWNDRGEEPRFIDDVILIRDVLIVVAILLFFELLLFFGG